jgi:hypothetical protein
MSSPAEPGDGTPTRFFIAHMQKTAGTTVRDRLRATFTDDQIYPNAGDGPDIRHAVISVSYLQDRWATRRDEIRLLTGHFPLRVVEVLDADFVRLTVLRHPVERTLSFLRHQAARRQRGATENTPLDVIYDDPFRFDAMIHDHMVRVLSLAPEEWGPGDGVLTTVPYTRDRLEMAEEALAGIEMFGLQTHLDEFCDDLAARYGLALGEPVHSNTTEPVEIPAGLEDRIAEDNALDMELYEYGCRLYEQRRS